MSIVIENSNIKENRSRSPKRWLGRYSMEVPGPVIVCICSIHGNEPSGTVAFKKVIKTLDRIHPEFHGELIGLLGNIGATGINERFIDVDLNRLWTRENIDKIKKKRDINYRNEHLELYELYSILAKVFQQSKGPIFVIDLHTTSSKSTPFISINDTIRNRDFALHFNLPVVLGIEEFLEGTILNYINELGFVALGFEGGQHQDPVSVKVHESAIWTTLLNSGCIDQLSSMQDYHSNILKTNSTYSGHIFDVRYRHIVNQNDNFKMLPGYVNFQRIKKKELLATDKKGEIRSPSTSRIFMPLYQKLGNDGFFIVRRIRFFWLLLSKILRTYNFHYLLYMLPGVTTHLGKRTSIVVNQHIARYGVVDFFHLLGFRRKTKKGNLIIFEKREFDTHEPDKS